jgi:microcystin-dependent protein
MPIAENEALFQLIGTTYGGDGQTTFALPDLRGRVPLHQGPGFELGQPGGAEAANMSVDQMPAHAHAYSYQPAASSGSGTQTSPEQGHYGGSGRKAFYADKSAINETMAGVNLEPSVQTGPAGQSSNALDIRQPYLAVSYVLSLSGIFPSPF